MAIGLPARSESVITHPLGALELRDMIYSAHGPDISTAVLTQVAVEVYASLRACNWSVDSNSTLALIFIC